ncbi:MAG: copper homeostasis protein CutC [Gemmatimonadota bacterium]
MIFEACVDSVESALAAVAGGAGRLELCDDLVEGGTTPSAGMIDLCRERVLVPLFVLIRPRGGDFVYSADEREVMLRDILLCQEARVDGVVVGALRPDGTVDADAMRPLVEAAHPMEVTFHRAFDSCRDPRVALETLIELGVDRVLTSGQAPSALEGAAMLAQLVEQAAGRIEIMAGGGVNETNVSQIIEATGVGEVHASVVTAVSSVMTWKNERVVLQKALPADEGARLVTNAARVERIVERMHVRTQFSPGHSPAASLRGGAAAATTR